MSEFEVIATRTPGMSEKERQRRLSLVYDIILGFRLDDEAAGVGTVGSQTTTAAGDTDPSGTDADSVYHTTS